MESAINKLRIISLKNPKEQLSGSSLSPGQLVGFIADAVTSRIFEAQINPEQITRNFKVIYANPAEPGSGTDNAQFAGVDAELLELRFILDGTGAVKQNDIPAIDVISEVAAALPDEAKSAYVVLKVAQLQSVVYDFYDQTHRTPFVLVNYGKLVFMGILEEMTMNYNLFSPAGIPLRAEVTLKLKSQRVPNEKSALMSLLSPDLTRHHVVKAGENILRISLEAYESDRYYLEIAKTNKLVNFRKIAEGTRLILPPIDKSRPS
jgi:Contractile injection system tube protein